MNKPKRDPMTLSEKLYVVACSLVLALFTSVVIWAVVSHPIPTSADEPPEEGKPDPDEKDEGDPGITFTYPIVVNPEGGGAAQDIQIDLRGDINHDGLINAKDASLILMYSAYCGTTPDALTLDKWLATINSN